MYLGYNVDYCQRVYNSLVSDVAKLYRNFIYWKDYIWRFQAFFDPQSAISSYDENYQFDNGHTKTFLYHWLHNFNVLGNVSTKFYSDNVSYAVFEKDNIQTFVVFNFEQQTKNVNFYKILNNEYIGSLEVPPYSMVVSSSLVIMDLKPNVSIKNLTDFTTIYGQIQILIEASDDNSLKRIELYLDDNNKVTQWDDIFLSSTTLMYNLNTTGFPDGKHEIKVVAFDLADNSNEYKVNLYFYNSTIEDTYPYVKIQSPQEGQIVSSNVYIVVIATDDINISKVEFYINNLIKYTSNESPYMFLWDTTEYEDGGYENKSCCI